MRRLFIRSGGGLPGLDIHVGIWLALADAGIRSTENAGASAGALISAMDSALYSAQRASDILEALSDSSVRSERFAWKLRIPWIESFLSHAPILKLLDRLAPVKFSNLQKPLTVAATDHRRGWPRLLTQGDLRRALLASMSISGVFPPVKIGNELLSDGGSSSYLPLPKGWQDADEIWLLIAKRPLEYKGHGILGRLMWNLDLLMEDQVRDTVALVQATIGSRCRLIQPGVRTDRSSLHFDHRLIQETRQLVQQQLRFSTLPLPKVPAK